MKNCNHFFGEYSIIFHPFLVSDGGPVLVVINLYLRTISKVDDVNMVIRASAKNRLICLGHLLVFIHKIPLN